MRWKACCFVAVVAACRVLCCIASLEACWRHPTGSWRAQTASESATPWTSSNGWTWNSSCQLPVHDRHGAAAALGGRWLHVHGDSVSRMLHFFAIMYLLGCDQPWDSSFVPKEYPLNAVCATLRQSLTDRSHRVTVVPLTSDANASLTPAEVWQLPDADRAKYAVIEFCWVPYPDWIAVAPQEGQEHGLDCVLALQGQFPRMLARDGLRNHIITIASGFWYLRHPRSGDATSSAGGQLLKFVSDLVSMTTAPVPSCACPDGLGSECTCAYACNRVMALDVLRPHLLWRGLTHVEYSSSAPMRNSDADAYNAALETGWNTTGLLDVQPIDLIPFPERWPSNFTREATEARLTIDGYHPTQAVQALMIQQLASAIKELMQPANSESKPLHFCVGGASVGTLESTLEPYPSSSPACESMDPESPPASISQRAATPGSHTTSSNPLAPTQPLAAPSPSSTSAHTGSAHEAQTSHLRPLSDQPAPKIRQWHLYNSFSWTVIAYIVAASCGVGVGTLVVRASAGSH